MGWQTGYCTNVHAGADLPETRAQLERHALAVKQQFAPDRTIGIGLWLSASSARAILEQQRLGEWRNWLAAHGLMPYTMNAFPFGDFHAQRVLHQVYLPTWMDRARLDYTLAIVTILDGLLPPGVAGTISTLPIAWGQPALSADAARTAAAQLFTLAGELEALEAQKGRHIRVCLEPEPGCIFQRAPDVVDFFDRYLHPLGRERVDRYLGVCHDVCHSAVMFEPQRQAIFAYRQAGIHIGKVQISAAVSTPPHAIAELRAFAEERYLHQTVKRDASGATHFFENLPDALADDRPALEWRTHFHVPIYLQQFGQLRSTQTEIIECLHALQSFDEPPHFEVETYSWGVLPAELQQPTLASGIAEELRWFAAQSQSLIGT